MDPIDKEEYAPDASSETSSPAMRDPPVGYGNPPMQRRFKSGQSGNQRGRPRGSKNWKTVVREIANEMHVVIEDGCQRRRSTLELMLIALRNGMAEGNVRAFRAYRKYLEKYDPRPTNPKGGYLVVPAVMTEEEARAEGEKLNAEACARRAAQSQKES